MMEKGDFSQSCVERLKNISPGTHICYFYHAAEDLYEILIPYFAEGLSNNDLCIWVCPDRIHAERAKAVFYERFPYSSPEKYFLSGQVRILDATQWYIAPRTRRFSLEFTRERNLAISSETVRKGFTGIRASWDAFWLGDESWPAFLEYEHFINQVLPASKNRAICTYPLSRCGPSEIIDVTCRHKLSLLRTESGYKLSESGDLQPDSQTPEKSLPSPSFCALSAREEERKKISRSLHSSIGSLSISLSSKLQSAEREIKTQNLDNALRSLCEAQAVLQSEVHKIKSLAYGIRPPELHLVGFAEAVEAFFSSLAKKKNIDFRFNITPAISNISELKASVLFRIIHEAFINVLKHARAKTLELRLSHEAGKIRLSIRDDGQGFDAENAFVQPLHTLGLVSMKEMAESLGGTFRIRSAPAKGTIIEVVTPINNPISTKKRKRLNN